MLTPTPRSLMLTATPLVTSPGFEPGTQPHLDESVLHMRSRDVTDTALHLLIYLKSEKGRASVMLGGEEGERAVPGN